MPEPRFQDVTGAEDRLPREAKERRNEERKTRGWKPPSVLPPLPEKKDGKVFRWIRTQVRGELDPRNLSMRFREGWVPVKATDYPELVQQMPQQVETRFPDGIEVGSVVLCVNSAAAMEERKKYYAAQTSQQIQALDNSMFKLEDQKRMPMFKTRQSRVSVGKRNQSEE